MLVIYEIYFPHSVFSRVATTIKTTITPLPSSPGPVTSAYLFDPPETYSTYSALFFLLYATQHTAILINMASQVLLTHPYHYTVAPDLFFS